VQKRLIGMIMADALITSAGLSRDISFKILMFSCNSTVTKGKNEYNLDNCSKNPIKTADRLNISHVRLQISHNS
jgi:hypothetical protein